MSWRSFLFLLLAPTLAACEQVTSVNTRVAGAADYTVSSPGGPQASDVGALPVEILHCERRSYEIGGGTPVSRGLVRLGNACTLPLDPKGETCDLPSAHGPLRVAVSSLSVSYAARFVPLVGRYRGIAELRELPLTLTLGGTTVDDGRYVAFRFAGSQAREGAKEECGALLGEKPPVPVAAASIDWSAWKNGKVCTALDCGP